MVQSAAYRPYLFEKEFQPVKFAAEPLLQADRERSSIASSERLQLLAPIAPNRLEFSDALCEQKPLYAVDILNPFGSQGPALTADLPTVFLFRRGRLCHGADLVGGSVRRSILQENLRVGRT